MGSTGSGKWFLPLLIAGGNLVVTAKLTNDEYIDFMLLYKTEGWLRDGAAT